MSSDENTMMSLEKIAIGFLEEIGDYILQECDGVSADRVELSEAVRIVASDMVIAAYYNEDPKEILANPNMGITELSHLVREENRERIWEIVSQSMDWNGFLRASERFRNMQAREVAEILGTLHLVTVYGNINFGDNEIGQGHIPHSRKLRGVFYTPNSVTRFICEGTVGKAVDDALSKADIEDSSQPVISLLARFSVIDPACGTGAFLLAALDVMIRRYDAIRNAISKYPAEREFLIDAHSSLLDAITDTSAFTDFLIQRIYGVDIDSAAAEITSICISIAGHRPMEQLKSPFLKTIKPGNSLVSEFPVGTMIRHDSAFQKLKSRWMKIRELDDYRARKERYSEYRAEAQEAESSTLIDFSGKRASSVLADGDCCQRFCWELEFPEIFADSEIPALGFLFGVMNPPYDILKLNKSEFLHTNQTASEREQAISLFKKMKKVERRRARFFRRSNQYEYSANGVINLYRLMIERLLQVTSEDAAVGFIVPSTLLCDNSAAKLRKHILNNYQVVGIDDFPEKARVFENVTQAVSIMRIDKSSPPHSIPLAIHKGNHLDSDRLDYYSIPLTVVRNISGENMYIPRVTSDAWKILGKIHRWPKVEEAEDVINRRGELDLTAFKKFITARQTNSHLIRGRDISRYCVDWKPGRNESYVHFDRFMEAIESSSKREDVLKRRIAGQQICNMAQRWRLKFGLVEPESVLGNSCNYLLVDSEDGEKRFLMFLLGLFNSNLLNWRFRLTSTNNHVNNGEIDLLPIPHPSAMNEREYELFESIAKNAENLICRHDAELDWRTEAMVFRIYGLSESEVLTVLSHLQAPKNEKEGIMKHFLSL